MPDENEASTSSCLGCFWMHPVPVAEDALAQMPFRPYVCRRSPPTAAIISAIDPMQMMVEMNRAGQGLQGRSNGLIGVPAAPKTAPVLVQPMSNFVGAPGVYPMVHDEFPRCGEYMGTGNMEVGEQEELL